MTEREMGPEYFRRVDDNDDAGFYVQPRLVHHIDDDAIAALTGAYREMLPEGGAILDLMSSWVSHLPDDIDYTEVVGLGMNRTELEANPRLNRFLVHDLNADPRLPFDDDAFDACTIAVSVQYLVDPFAVFAEIARVLKPDAPCVVSFSNRCFPTKAVAVWQGLGDADHAKLVGYYFVEAGGFGEPEFIDRSPAPGKTDPLYIVSARAVPSALT